MYAVIAPGFSCVYTSWKDVERVKSLYPFPKWKKFYNQADAEAWILRNKYARQLDRVYNYGNSFAKCFIEASYTIADECVYYKFNIKRVGHVLFDVPTDLIEYKGSIVYIKETRLKVSNGSLNGHMAALAGMFAALGDNVDVNIKLDYYAVYYALNIYERGRITSVDYVKSLILRRLGATSISLSFKKEGDESYG